MDHLTHTDTLLPAEIAPVLQSALWATIGSLILSVVGPMTCYISYLIALPLGTWGAWKGWQLNQATAPESSEHALAQIALVGGLIAALCSAFFVFIMVAVVSIYVLMFLLMVGSAAVG